MPAEAIVERSIVERASTAFGEFLDHFSTTFSDVITSIFKAPLSKIFDPINSFLNSYYQPQATIFSLGLFFTGMLFVLLLKKEYVNLDSPGKGLLYDLRLWTIVSMTPHVIVYIYFSRWS